MLWLPKVTLVCVQLSLHAFENEHVQNTQLTADIYGGEHFNRIILVMESLKALAQGHLSSANQQSHGAVSAATVTPVTSVSLSHRFPVSFLSDGQWHRVAMSVSKGRLTLYVDCVKVESVDWTYRGLGISTDGLLIMGGIIEGFETPFEVGVSLLTLDCSSERQPLLA